MDTLFNTTGATNSMFSQVVEPATKYVLDPAAKLLVDTLPAPLGQHIVDSGALPWFFGLAGLWVSIEVADIVRGVMATNASRRLREKKSL